VEVGVLALQGDVGEHRAAFAELGVATRAVRRPDDLVGLDGIVLPGGESTTMSLLLDSSGLAEPLGKQLSAGLPAFGTCAGLILLSTAIADGRPDQRCYGAIDLSVRRNGFGRQVQSFECALPVVGLPGRAFPAVFIRAPVVDGAGPEVEVLASVPLAADDGLLGADASVRARTPVLCRQGPVLVCAFHPELTGDRRLHQMFVSMIEGTGRPGPATAAGEPAGDDVPEREGR